MTFDCKSTSSSKRHDASLLIVAGSFLGCLGLVQ
jgi:hypothetical protein